MTCLGSQVRLHEKACDEYASRFQDGIPPESCVMDVVRARIVGESGFGLRKLLASLRKGFACTIGRSGAEIELICGKNKFARPDSVRVSALVTFVSYACE